MGTKSTRFFCRETDISHSGWRLKVIHLYIYVYEKFYEYNYLCSVCLIVFIQVYIIKLYRKSTESNPLVHNPSTEFIPGSLGDQQILNIILTCNYFV